MSSEPQEFEAARYLVCNSPNFVVKDAQSVTDLVGACLDCRTRNVMIHECCLSPEFFDLKTGLAGELFQKLANYHVRAAAVIDAERVLSDRFTELARETNRGNQFRFYHDRESAEAWLIQD